MATLLELLGAIAAEAGAEDETAERAGATAAEPIGARLTGQLRRWAASRGGEETAPPALLLLGVLTWTRLHGIVTLELAGVVGDMGLDAGALVQAELAAIVAAAGSGIIPASATETRRTRR